MCSGNQTRKSKQICLSSRTSDQNLWNRIAICDGHTVLQFDGRIKGKDENQVECYVFFWQNREEGLNTAYRIVNMIKNSSNLRNNAAPILLNALKNFEIEQV